LSSLLAALSFLTVFPVPQRRELSQQAVSNSRAWFPLVGLLIGLALVGLERLLGYVFSPYLTAALLVVFLVIVNRALHLDGLMDTCDGLFGGQTPERRREIMRDSSVGAFAVAGAGSVLLLKYTAILSLLSANVPGREAALLVFPVVSRYAMVLQLFVFPYVRAPGLGSPFHNHDARLPSIAAAVMAALTAGLLGGLGGILILATICLLALALGRLALGLIGGLTGDIYGATNELSEVAALLAAVALLPLGLLSPITRPASVYLGAF
jgi:adenosylcobinamide-GDP ribazoletransferase